MLRDALTKLLELPATERIDIAMALRESLTPAEQEAEFDPILEQRAELDRRLAEHVADPASAVPWEEVRRPWVRDGLLKLGGRGGIAEVARQIWEEHESELRPC